MHRPPWKLLLSVTLLGLFASGASAALIDGFGDSGVPTGGGGNMVVPADGQTNPPAVGSYIDYKNNIASDIIFGPGQPPGEREVECKIISNPRSQFAFAGVFNTFGNSFADLQSPSLGEAEMILRYGSLITTATGTNLDADMSNEAFLDFYVIGNDHPQDRHRATEHERRARPVELRRVPAHGQRLPAERDGYGRCRRNRVPLPCTHTGARHHDRPA